MCSAPRRNIFEALTEFLQTSQPFSQPATEALPHLDINIKKEELLKAQLVEIKDIVALPVEVSVLTT